MAPKQHAYAPLSPDKIRILRLPPPELQHITPLQCKLEAIDPSECKYEALSYCWGGGGKKRRNTGSIVLDGEPFSISEDLASALSTLCSRDRSQALWVDAICINQADSSERNIQVAKMREIYSRAQRTIVWVGPAKDGTEAAFERIEQLALAASDEAKQEIWSQEGPWIDRLNEIIDRPYWGRAWTVQEVVVSPDSILYCGSSFIPFFDLAKVLLHPETKNHVDVTYSTYSYLKSVVEMRDPNWRDPKLGLFELAYRFRHRNLTNDLDRVYAFRGLIKSQDLLQDESAVVNYKQSEQDLWEALSKDTMVRHQTLLPMAVSGGRTALSLMDGRWYKDFSLGQYEPNESFELALFSSGGLDDPLYHPLQVHRFDAAGGSKARVEVNDKMPALISVKGFISDEIVAVGKAVTQLGSIFGRPNYVKLFESWESLVGGPWEDSSAKVSHDGAFSAAEIFALTITGGAWTEKPLDWRHWNTLDHSQRYIQNRSFYRHILKKVVGAGKGNPQATNYNVNRHPWLLSDNVEYDRLRDDACESRRMALFKSGRFGLTSERAKAGDKLAILLGCDVPMIIHTSDDPRGLEEDFDFQGKDELYETTWRLRGQAYVHDLMHYQGDLESDITNGKVTLETFVFD